jgi:hypothetical protein
MTRLAPVHLPFLTTSNLESAQRGLIPGRSMLVGSSSEYWCDADDIKDMGASGNLHIRKLHYFSTLRPILHP